MHTLHAVIAVIAAPAWLASAWAWILANPGKDSAFLTFLLSSLITKLTPYPTDAGFISFLQVILDTLSFLSHSNAVGVNGTGVNLPGIRSTPPAGTPVLSLAAAVGIGSAPPAKGYASAVVLATAGIALVIASTMFYACATVKKDVAAGVAAVEACKGIEESALPGLLIVGVDLLEQLPEATWISALENALGPAASCVTQHVEASLAASAPATDGGTDLNSLVAPSRITVATETPKARLLRRARTYNALKVTP